MKRSLTFFSALTLLVFGMIQNSFAQSDDVYYDPTKDKGVQNNTQQYDNNNQNPQSSQNNNSQQQQTDKTDGYGTPADKYDPRDNYNTSSNSYTDSYGNSYTSEADYYDDDYSSYFYTTRLNRYYRPNYGVNYHSYWFTPTYYGYNSYNTYAVSYNPWYNDSWWRWNRRHTTVVIIDPFYDPYWDWNFGWNSCAYYNSWSHPYWGYNNYNYYGYGYGGYGYGCGYGGGYGGYYNSYNNGYWNGYYNGYNDGYYNSTAYNNGYYYNGPRHHRDGIDQQNQNRLPVTNTSSGGTTNTHGGLTGKPVDVDLSTHNINIPKEGITKPFTPNAHTGNTNGIKIESNTEKPYVNLNGANNTLTPSVNVKPNEGNIGVHNNNTNHWDSKDEKLNNFNGGNMPPSQNASKENNITGKYAEPKNTKPFVQQNNNEPEGWHTAPPDRWSNKQPVQQQPNQNDWNAQPRGNYSQPQRNNLTQQNNVPQPRPENNNWNRVEPRNAEPRNTEQPRMNVQPQQPRQEIHQQNFNRVEPQHNFSAPQQRSYSPAPQGGVGGFKRH